jgi:hypothetical protein
MADSAARSRRNRVRVPDTASKTPIAGRLG